ncbi:MAG TPA: orotidine-5'-phosphate decarboxylase [Sandaracinaceae bacterium LLY-WYZ-13_1]|nr:orotidine-5'-phosphate decarboxylase [Sandaracinaceae bacterium LLY-WYZ-13_1]
MRARDRLIVALDVPSLEAARPLIAALGPEAGVLKVGLELFVAAGPAAVDAVHEAGGACFLDLKLHDIPATVAEATRAAVALGVRFLTVHASAGPAALAAAAQAAAGTGTQLLAVTALTSLDGAQLEALGLEPDPPTVVTRLARLATDAGVTGFVCSPHETRLVRDVAGTAATVVTPGVRPAGTARGDQRRVATPAEAIRAGADRLVVGRPIREADDPVAAARAVTAEIASATGEDP